MTRSSALEVARTFRRSKGGLMMSFFVGWELWQKMSFVRHRLPTKRDSMFSGANVCTMTGTRVSHSELRILR